MCFLSRAFAVCISRAVTAATMSRASLFVVFSLCMDLFLAAFAGTSIPDTLSDPAATDVSGAVWMRRGAPTLVIDPAATASTLRRRQSFLCSDTLDLQKKVRDFRAKRVADGTTYGWRESFFETRYLEVQSMHKKEKKVLGPNPENCQQRQKGDCYSWNSEVDASKGGKRALMWQGVGCKTQETVRKAWEDA